MHILESWSRCISLRESAERRQDTRKEFARHNAATTFFVVDRDNENPGRGCYTSHYKCMQKALRAGVPHALVFEDDVEFEDDAPQRAWEEAAQFVRAVPFDILLLGWCEGSGYRQNICSTKAADRVVGFQHIFKTKCLCSHAIVYSRKFMERFVRDHAEYPGYEMDDVFVDMKLDMYMVSPMLFDQRDVESTIDDPNIERVFIPRTLPESHT
jgi:hypothetical protein